MYAELSSEIIFFYPLETIVDRMKMYSQYRVRNTEEPDDNFLTSEDEDLLKVESDRAVMTIFQTAMKLSDNISGAVLSNTSTNISGVDYVGLYGFRLLNLHGYNPNILSVIDQNIEKLLTSLVLANWYTLTNKPDILKVVSSALPAFQIQYNNSLTELYKPYFLTVAPVYSTSDVEVDDDTNAIVTQDGEEIINSDTQEMADPLYFDTFSDFPETGTTDTTYTDKETNTMYLWNGSQYVKINTETPQFSVEFENVSSVSIQHNLGKTMPDIKMTDADGDDWDVDYDPTDENSGVVSWEGNKTGTIYAS